MEIKVSKKILIILGHPNKNSFGKALAAEYKEGAKKTGAQVKELYLSDLNFNPNLPMGYKQKPELEDDLKKSQEDILWADHLVFVYPSWWGTMPAMMKGFIDRVFLPGFAFKYRKDSLLWDKLLTGKTARLIVTMDAPPWYFRWVNKRPGHNAMKNSILKFCGVKPVKISSIGPIKSASDQKLEGGREKIRRLGENQK